MISELPLERCKHYYGLVYSEIAIGMLFTFQRYDEFGINIFEYTDVLDFLIAPFGDGFIIFLPFYLYCWLTLYSSLIFSGKKAIPPPIQK